MSFPGLLPAGSWTQFYGYNSSRRLTSITTPAISSTPFSYTYLGASRQVSQVTFPTGAKVVNSYDALARLTATAVQLSPEYFVHSQPVP